MPLLQLSFPLTYLAGMRLALLEASTCWIMSTSKWDSGGPDGQPEAG